MDKDKIYYQLHIQHGSKRINEVNNWPVWFKQDLRLMLAVAKSMVRRSSDPWPVIPGFKITIVQVDNNYQPIRQRICLVTDREIKWTKNEPW